MPAISIIMPVYNVEQYLTECLDSVLAQTLKDIEVICVNDGSTDGSQKILERYAAKDGRVTLVQQENKGVSAARNAGFLRAKGEYVSYVDPDDTVDPRMCEIAYGYTLDTKADIVVFGFKEISRMPMDPWYEYVSNSRFAWYTPFDIQALLGEPGGFPFVWRSIYRREKLIRGNVMFESDLRYGEDAVYQFTALPNAQRIQFIPDKLYNYRRMRKKSLTRAASEHAAELIRQHIGMLRRVRDIWEQRGWMKQYSQELHGWMLHFIFDDFWKVKEADRIKLSAEFLESFADYEEYLPFLNENDVGLYTKALNYSMKEKQA